jgi:hypothetical protein
MAKKRKRKRTAKKKKGTGCKVIRLGKGKGNRYGCFDRNGRFKFVKEAVYKRRKAL